MALTRRSLLTAVATFVTAVHIIVPAGAHVVNASTFEELNQAASGRATVSITTSDVVFPHQLDVLAHAVVTVQSTIGATLSGGNQNRLFSIQNRSRLSLHGLNLEDASCSGFGLCSGGALYVDQWCEVRLTAVRISSCRADYGAGIYVGLHAAVVATDCTLTSNAARLSGGGVYAASQATVAINNCTVSSNSATFGGAVRAATDTGGAVTMTDCTMTENTASWGGVVFVSGTTTYNAAGCTMAANLAKFGGALIAEDDAIAIVSDCTITSNAATEQSTRSVGGGAVYASGRSAVIATDCSMNSNTAERGGAVYAGGESAFVATNCTMASNRAEIGGGAVHAAEKSTVTVTDCTMTSNTAGRGGAVYAASSAVDSTSLYAGEYPTITATYCTIASNRAESGGGAVYLAEKSTVTATDRLRLMGCQLLGNSARTGGALLIQNNSAVHIRDSMFESNRAKTLGAAVLAQNGDLLILIRSSFESNFVESNFTARDADVGVGIVVNVGMRVQCDMDDCLQVCTACRDPQNTPTLQPTSPAVTMMPTDSWDEPSNTEQTESKHHSLWSLSAGALIGAIFFLAVGTTIRRRWWCKLHLFDRQDDDATVSEDLDTTALVTSLLADGDLAQSLEDGSRSLQSIEMMGTTNSSVPHSILSSSPAPIIVVDGELRITIWSPGKSINICI